MILSGILFPIFIVTSVLFDEGGPLIIPVTVFLVALAVMIFSRVFGKDTPASESQVESFHLGARSDASALPPASTMPIYGRGDVAGQKMRTNELAQPPSVTEHTTKLLDDERERPIDD